MEIVKNLNSRSLVTQQVKKSKNYSPAVCDVSTENIENDQTGIEKLNDDCLMQIFTYIPRGNHFVLEKVCKRWEVVSRLMWRTFKKFDFKEETWGDKSTCDKLKLLNIETLEKVLYRCGSFLTHIDFSKRPPPWTELGGKVVSIFAKYCRNLQNINVVHFYLTSILHNPIYEKELSNLFLNNKKLRYVRLVKTSITGKCLLNLSANYLETLIIDSGFNISPCYIEQVVKKFKKLHTLSISVFDLTYETFKMICFCAESLKELHLREFPIPKVSCYDKLYVTFVNLEVLDVGLPDYINDQVLKVIGENCKKLKKVNLSYNHKISNKGLANIVSLPNLQCLDISFLQKITDEILTDMPNLHKLKCSGCDNVKNQGLCQLIKKSHNLEILDVSDCEKVSNELVKMAIEATKNRSNNVTLKIYMYETSISISHVDLATLPLLQLIRGRILIFPK